MGARVASQYRERLHKKKAGMPPPVSAHDAAHM